MHALISQTIQIDADIWAIRITASQAGSKTNFYLGISDMLLDYWEDHSIFINKQGKLWINWNTNREYMWDNNEIYHGYSQADYAQLYQPAEQLVLQFQRLRAFL